MSFPEAVRPLAEAVLIGFLVGAEREFSREETERQPGVRDFVLIALVGAVAALLDNPSLAVAALLSIAALLTAFHVQAGGRSGITTELAAVATFCLGFLTASPDAPIGGSIAGALTIVMVLLLEAKRALHRFLREAVTGVEFADTVRFLAIIFVIYPLLPEGRFGPYEAFAPRQIWVFIILVSSVSYVGYFLEKFLGARIGLRLAGLLAGLASTTAATASFARSASEEPSMARRFSRAAVLANAMQFPRVLAILFVANPPLAMTMLPSFAVMTLAGIAFGWEPRLAQSAEARAEGVRLRNPFHLRPALKLGVLFAAVVFLGKAAMASLGASGVIWVAALAGSVDVDAAVLAVSDVGRGPALAPANAALALYLALVANAVLKIGIAVYAGSIAFARRLIAAFCVMFLTGAAAWLAGLRW